jgi:predicted MFS family arabinose efflux permease
MNVFLRVYRHRDFRYLWLGAFFSFIGSWVQTVGQGFLVYDLSGDKTQLGWISFLGSLPVLIAAPLLGGVSDSFNKRHLLVLCSSVYGGSALFLAYASYSGFVQVWHVACIAVLNGFVGCIEMPVRQSIVSKVVPPEDLPAAIPLNAMTFNLARLVGPALGGWLLAEVGVPICYLVNGLSYIAIVMAVFAIRTDLRAMSSEPQPIVDLMLEGLRYVFRTRSFRSLFILESIVSMLALTYIPLMPAIARDVLNLDEKGLGYAYLSIGVGSVAGLLTMARINARPIQPTVIRTAMTVLSLCLIALSFTRSVWVAFPLFALMGASTVAHFNTTNTLFQVLSPERIRGRVLSMHVWALAGASTLGALPFAYLAELTSLQISLMVSGVLTLCGAIWAWLDRVGLSEAKLA